MEEDDEMNIDWENVVQKIHHRYVITVGIASNHIPNLAVETLNDLTESRTKY